MTITINVNGHKEAERAIEMLSKIKDGEFVINISNSDQSPSLAQSNAAASITASANKLNDCISDLRSHDIRKMNQTDILKYCAINHESIAKDSGTSFRLDRSIDQDESIKTGEVKVTTTLTMTSNKAPL